MIEEYINLYIEALTKVLRGKKIKEVKLKRIQDYFKENNVMYYSQMEKIVDMEKTHELRYEFEKIVLSIIAQDQRIEKLISEEVIKKFQNEVCGINRRYAEYGDIFHGELIRLLSGEKSEIEYFRNSHELFFLLFLEEKHGEILEGDAAFIYSEMKNQAGDWIFYDDSIFQVLEFFLMNKKNDYAAKYIIKLFIDGIEKKMKSNEKKIIECLKKNQGKYRRFGKTFDEMFLNYIEANDKKEFLNLYKKICSYLGNDEFVIPEFKIKRNIEKREQEE